MNISLIIHNNEFFILDKFIFQESNHITIVTMVHDDDHDAIVTVIDGELVFEVKSLS